MRNSDRYRELTAAAIVIVGYTADDGQDCQKKCVVPAGLLWSPEGVAELFEALRIGLLGERDGQNDDAWESFHVVSMQEHTEYAILDEPEGM